MSKQHLWPKWMQKPFPKANINHTNTRLKTKLVPGRGIEMRPYLKIHQGDIKTRQLRIVCEYHCNNGWINHVEDSTKEFLTPLVNGEFFTLTEEYQRRFALWLAIACTVWEYTDPESSAIPKDDREYIHSKREPPSSWSMWIGSYRGTEWKDRYRHVNAHAVAKELLTPAYAIGPQAPNSQTSSVQIGELFMHVSSSTLPAEWQFDQERVIPGMLRLWPMLGYPIQWPNLFTLDDRAAMMIADRLLTSGIGSLRSFDW